MANATTFNRILSKGIESELPKVVDGRLRFTTDTGRLFLDNGNERVEISDFVKGQTSTQITGTLAPLPKFYLASDTNVLYFYAGGQWNTVKAANASTADYSNNASTADYAKNAIKTITRSGNKFTATRFDGTTFTFTQQNSTYKNGEGLSLNSGTFSINKDASTVKYATQAGSANSASSATNAGTAEYATNAGTADYAINSSTADYSKNASSVGGFTVGKSVPSNAVFTDTKYAAGTGLNLNSNTFSINTSASTVAYATNSGTSEYATNADAANTAANATCATNASSVGGFTVGKSVPSNAVFTDTTYSAATGGGLSLSSGAFSINKDASTVKYATKAGSADNATCATNSSSVGGFTVGKSVPSNAVFTDTKYAAGTGLSLNSGTFSIDPDASTVAYATNSGTATYATNAGSAANATCATNASSVSGHTVAVNVPSNAKFTDTTYKNGTGLLLNSGTFSIDTTASTVAYATNAGSADSATSATNATCATNASSVNGFTVGVSVPANAKFTDNDTKNTAGATNTSSKIFLVGATSQGANPQTYTHDTAYVGTDGYLYSGGNKVLTTSEKGAASGVAELDSTGKVPSSQLPSFVDDVIEGYYYNSKFYEDSAHTTEITPESGKIYVDLSTDKTYRWSGSAYTQIKGDLALGETSSTAYRGDRGKIAYDHSQAAHAPSNAQPNQNAFSNVKVGSTTIAADTTTDTLEIAAGDNITLTPDATNDKLTITATDTTYAAGEGLSLNSGTFSINKDASTVKYATNAGSATNAASVGGFTVGKSVPSNAVFTDTKYAAGTGLSLNSGTFSVDSSASTVAYATNSGTADYATNAGSADNATSATNATCATNASSVGGFTVGKNVPSNAVFTDTTYATFSTATNGLVKASGSGGASKFLKGDNTWGTPTDTKYAAGAGLSLNSGTFSIDTTASTVAYATNSGTADYATNAGSATNASSVGGFTVGVSVPANAKFTDTTYGVVSTTANGLAPKVTDTSKFLKGDGTWATPTNTTYGTVSTTANGLAPKVTSTSGFLKGDGTWATPTNTTYSAATGGGLTLSSGAFSINKDASTVKYATNSGTATYATNAGSADNATCATNSSSVGGFTVGVSVPANAKFTDTTYATFSTATNGLVPKPTNATTAQFLRGNGTWATPTNTTYADMTTAEYDTGTSTTTRVLSPKRLKEIFSVANAASATNASTADYAINAGSATNASSVGGFTVGVSVPANAKFTDTTYAVVSTTANGLAPKVTDTSKFLKGDGTWATPTNTTYADMTTAEFDTGTSTTTRVLSPKRLKEIFSVANASSADYAKNASSVGGFTVGKSVPSNAVFTDTTYSASTGISISSAKAISLATTGTAGTYGPTADVTGSNNTTIAVPQITTDSYGRVTGATTFKYTSKDTSYSGMTTAEFNAGTLTTTRVISPKILKDIFSVATASSATNAGTAAYAIVAGNATSSDNASSAGYATNAGTADYATNAASVGGYTVGKSVPSNANFNDTTYGTFSTAVNGLVPKPTNATTAQFLRGNGTWATPTNTTYANVTSATAGLAPAGGSGTTKYLRQDGSWQVPPNDNTTYGVVSTTANGLAPKITDTSKFLKGDGTWATPTNTTYANATTAAAGLLPTLAGGTTKYLRADGSWQVPPNDNTTYGNMTSAAAGLAPAGGSGTTKYLRQDGSWQVPPNDNTTYGNITSATAGLAPAGGSGTTKYLRQDGSWQVPPNTTYAVVSTAANGLAPKVTSTSGFLKGDGTWATPTNTTYANVTSAAAGLAPAGGSGTTKYLRQDGSWQVPPNDNTTYGTFSTAANGLVPKPASAATTSYLNSSGTWTTPVGTTYSAGTGISISTAKAISLATTGTAGTYGPSANVTGNEGSTIAVPQITTDAYGRVTSVTTRTYTSKNTTYDLSAATVNTSTYSNRPMVEADFDFGELNSTTPGDESYNS